MKEKFKLTPLEKSWILYDIANSAFVLLAATLIPIFFNAVAGSAGLSETQYLSYWGYAGSISTLLVAFIGPVCGALTDQRGLKKPIFLITILLGAVGCAMLGFAWSWLAFLAIFVIAKVGFSSSIVFYDSMLPEITTEERMDKISSMGFAYGYIGSVIPFMIADGVLPSNEGRGYVLRRLLRRAARHGKLLGVNKPFLYEVVETVIRENEAHYTYLRERAEYITKIIKVEEENFARTIDTGMAIFASKMAEHKAAGKTVFSGEDAFLLADTYGFPVDLTVEMVEDEGMTLDMAKFTECREEQRVRAREARKALGDLGWAGVDLGKEIPETQFLGYDTLAVMDSKVLAIVVEDEQAEELMPGVEAIVVLDKTPFYAEMGGQVADHGFLAISGEHGMQFDIHDVQKNKGGKYLHYGKLVEGTLKLGDTVRAHVDGVRRNAIMRAHSATHLLDAALRSVLGDHVHQAGSLVMPDRLRFDFTHFSAMTAEELDRVNGIINDAILSGMEIVTEELPIEQAKERGAIALFGEKYGDTVRVVDMGKGFSVEFCGGTHLDNTAKVGPFRIVSEASVASGVRRIEAVTGKAFMTDAAKTRDLLSSVCSAVKVKNPADLEDKLTAQMEEIKELKKQIEQFKAKEAAGAVDQMLFGAKDISGLKVLTASVPGADAGKLRQIGDTLRDKASNVVAVLSSVNGEKISFLAVCGKDSITKGIKAGELVKLVCTTCGGSGGGKPDSAMGGGKDATKIAEALAQVEGFVSSKVK